MAELSESNARSPLERLSKGRYGRASTVKTKYANVDVESSVVAENNPNRVFLLLVNVYGPQATIGFDSLSAHLSGIPVSANGGSLSLSYEEDGEVVGYDVWASSAGGTGLVVVEVVVI